MTVKQAIAHAERILPGTPAPPGQRDVRWQAIIRVGEFIERDPEQVLAFALKWGRHRSADLRAAIGTCLLEHLLEHHFDLVFPRIKDAVRQSRRLAETFSLWSDIGQAKQPANARRIARLKRSLDSK